MFRRPIKRVTNIYVNTLDKLYGTIFNRPFDDSFVAIFVIFHESFCNVFC